MRYSSDHKAQPHQRIIKEASVRFRRDGIGATGLQPLIKALNLTHGGFYAHFKSMSSELGLRGQHSATTDAVLGARLKQIETALGNEQDDAQSLVMMSTLVGALVLARSVEDKALRCAYGVSAP
ncbi:TetR/AcrR family transcriptional regulator [Pseudomonas sp. EA_65y_Pfl1_P113]|uniref:TetR/AcrR family transcriptional regulator n=1 Tax=Pseudomonas sp. EA_65y_Pfl1_P113 TaxID=3088692 RepID=UPI0030D94D56